MDIKLKNYSYSLLVKIIVFILVIICFTGVMISSIDLLIYFDGNMSKVIESNYFLSKEHNMEKDAILRDLIDLVSIYKGEEYILNGGTITDREIKKKENELFLQFKRNSIKFNTDLNKEENYKEFKKEYSNEISSIKDNIKQNDLRDYKSILKRLEEYEGIVYYVSDGKYIYTNSNNIVKDYFKKYPSYIVIDKDETINSNNIWIKSAGTLDSENNTVYLSFSEEYLNPKIEEWKEERKVITNKLYRIGEFLLGLIISFVYLVITIGRKSFKDKEVQLNSIDRLPNDVNIAICLSLIGIWAILVEGIGRGNSNSPNILKVITPITSVISTFGLVLVLSLVKHFKNKTLIKNTLTYKVLYKIYRFIKDVYDNGSVGVKVIVVVVAYPLLTALTFFMFPITIGAMAWLCLIKVKEFNKIKEGIEKIRNGDMDHRIEIQGEGEFAKLSNDINSITEGLKKSVDNELKSERLKTELITNVSHDIRTPLTSIITYVDLLKNENDSNKSKEYIEILEQKSQRLKTLTDDLFEATKASSGNIPVNLEKIDMVSLLTQGLGELDDKIKYAQLDFKINHSKDKVYVTADGKLLWRVIENLLSNIFKYALKGSRVYIDIEESENTVILTMKNISAYELNISSDELMERFKRGDESRSSQGSGLGLSIAKSLIDVQNGIFNIEIDGDLFKSIIKLPIKSE